MSLTEKILFRLNFFLLMGLMVLLSKSFSEIGGTIGFILVLIYVYYWTEEEDKEERERVEEDLLI